MDPFNQLPCSLSLVWKEGKKKEEGRRWTGRVGCEAKLGSELSFTGGGRKNTVCALGGEAQFEALARPYGLCCSG